tara:strand:+ start:94 stop:408 length:315 start_codon:yes stop_codon:yes gene_type:complete
MTPTYPKWKVSYIEGIKVTTMKMVNKRKDVEWYEIGVFDEEWKPIPFVTKHKIFSIKYLGHAKFDVYISARDLERAEYICSLSKLKGNNMNKPMMSSKICSRFK